MNIIVNGGTRGIGMSIVEFLARDAENLIVVTGRNKYSLNGLMSRFSNVKAIQVDLSVFEKHSGLFFEGVKEQFKSIDILINTAGLLIKKSFQDIADAEARQIMDTNFFGPASVIKLLRPLMHKGTHIVNISSMGGFQGSAKYEGLSYYSAAKAALATLSECLALEYADSGIKVNCLALGAVQTEMFANAFPGFVAPVSAPQMAEFISGFALNGHKFFNGKILPVAMNNP